MTMDMVPVPAFRFYLLWFGLLVLAILALFSFFSCNSNPDTFAPKEVQDYIHLPTPHPVFRAADVLKYNLDYIPATQKFEEIYKAGLKNSRDSAYCLNQLAYLNLCINRDTVAGVWIGRMAQFVQQHGLENLDAGAQGDYWYCKGVWGYYLFKEPAKTIYALNQALKIYQKPEVYPAQHLKSYQTLNMLSMAHYDFDRLTDSCFESAKAASLYLKNPVFQRYKKENILILSYLQLADRNHINGIASCREAYNLAIKSKYPDTVFLIRILSQLGQMNKKSAELESDLILKQQYIGEAQSAIEKAMALSDIVSLSRTQESYSNAVYLYTFFVPLKCDTLFRKIDVIIKKQGQRYLYADRLKAYHQLFNAKINSSNPDKKRVRAVVEAYSAILERYQNDSLCHRHIFQEAYMSLARCYNVLKEYDHANQILKEALKYGTKLEHNDAIQIEDLLDSKLLKNGRSKFIYYSMIGANLLNKYKADSKRKVSLLSLSFDFLNITDSLFFSGIQSPDPDAVMSYYNEVSEKNSIFSNGLYATCELYDSTHQIKYLDAAFRFFEHKKSFLLYRDIREKRSDLLPKDTMDNLYFLGQAVNKLKWSKNKSGSKGTNIYSAQLDSLSKKLELLYAVIKEKYPDYYYAKVTPEIPSIAAVQDTLGNDQAIVQYGLDSENLFVLFVKKDSFSFKKIKIDSVFHKNIEILSSFLRGSYHSKILKREDTIWHTIYSLHNKLIVPFEGLLKHNIELIILPDNQLNMIPFEVLKPGYNSDYLIENIFVAYAPSWRIYQANHALKIADRNSNISFIGYGDKSTPGADRVCDKLQSIYGYRLNKYVGENCKKTAFTNPINASSIWNLSVHGHCNLSNIYENFLIFKQDTLYSFDLFEMKHIPRLLVLSSCNTANGKMVAGEGSFTLSRAFIQAGVPHVVSALWSVEDAIAGDVLSDFYISFASGKSISQSLGLAKRKFIRSLSTESIDWAALIYIV